MLVDDLVDQLASLSLDVGGVPQEKASKKLEYKDEGEHAIKQLEAHLARVRLQVSKPHSLGDAAKQEGKGLLKIAQAGLRNTAGGLEPLRLAYEASRSLLPLSPFISAADLTMERLWYKVASRSVELGDFLLGLRASACLQTCLDQRKGDDFAMRGGGDGGKDKADCCLVIVSKADGEDLRLRSFKSPGASGSMALAKLVSGACLNACRCCLEVASIGTLRLLAGELGRSAGRWIDRVSELGDDATADSYRGLLFKQLWLGCAALEKPGLGANSRECLLGRETALAVFFRKGGSWNADVFVAHALRGAVALQERAAGDRSSADEAAELSTFCLSGLSEREGEGWPVGVAESSGKLHPNWVDWLQYSAGLHEKTGQAAEAQRLLQLTFEYVQRCWKRQPKGGHRAAECAAYASILKMHTAAMITSLRSPDSAAAAAAAGGGGGPAATPRVGKQSAKRRGGKRAAEPSEPSSVVHALTWRGLDYLEDAVAALEALAEDPDGEGAGAEAAAFVGAAVKTWARAKKSCGVTALWVEEASGGEVESSGGKPGEPEWSALSARGHWVLADLSLKLELVRGRGSLGRVLERIPRTESLAQLAVDSYLRIAHAHLGALATTLRPGQATGVRAGRGQSQAGSDEDGARRALAAAEQTLENFVDVLPPQAIKRVGTGWFGLGTTLVDHGEVDTGVQALVQGCRLLERWTEAESDRSSESEMGSSEDEGCSSGPDVSEILRSAQLDMRLVKLSLVLQDSAAGVMAAAAVARALAFCPGVWCLSSSGGQPDSPAGALALVERFVGCKLRCGNSSDGGLTRDTAGTLSEYLSDGEEWLAGGVRTALDLPTALEKRGLSRVAIVWVLLAACRVYRAHLPLCISEEAGSAAAEEDEEEDEEEGGALAACVEGHRRATEAVLRICSSCQDGVDDGRDGAGSWEAQARLLAARFEHDLHLADVADGRAAAHEAGRVLADLPAGLEHSASGAAAASKLWGEEDSGSGSPVAAAAASAFACIRAMLLRSVAGQEGDVHISMHEGCRLIGQAARDSDWTPSHNSQANLGPAGAGTIMNYLDVLEAHYALHGDTLQRAKVAEVRLELADRVSLNGGVDSLPQGVATSAASLAGIGAVFQAGGLPDLGHMYGAAANEQVCELAVSARREAKAAGDELAKGAPSRAHVGAARVAVDVLRGMCLAEGSSSEEEGERVLLEARRAVSDVDTRVVAPATVAYLECVAGLGLSWVYQRSGRLVEAMGEVRQVMRLCRAWASAGGSLVASDKQVVALSAEKGDCIHDEGSDGLADAASHHAAAEEGVGTESGDTEDTLGEEAAGGGHDQERTGFALGSRWIPIYLEGLARMGRLWRERGVASKASLTLRQGCVMSESLHAARFLRHCLLEEIEVATGKHQFARADRLLRASRELLRQERRQLMSVEGSAVSSGCAACRAPDPTGAAVPGGGAPPPPTKGKGSKRGAKKPGGKGKPCPTAEAATPTRAACARCRELAVNTAELAAAEASLLRKQGGFVGALEACERGQAIVAPLLQAAGDPALLWSGSLSFARVSAEHGQLVKAAESNGLGWRAVEVLSTLRLQQGRVSCLLGNATAGEALLQDCSSLEGAPALVRATALYRIGRMSLDVGDGAGAKLPLERAEALARGTGAPKLVRKVRRALAVTLTELAAKGGPESVNIDGTWRVAALSSLSVGVTQCNQATHASSRRPRKGEVVPKFSGDSAGLRLFDAVSGGRGGTVAEACRRHEGSEVVCGEGLLEDAVTSDLRAEWPIVSLCLAPGEGACKRLLVTRLGRGKPPLTASVPLSPDDTRLLERWREIMEENRDSLRGHSAEEAAEYGNQQKAKWWERRVSVDEMVGDLLRDLEDRWLGVHGLAAVLLGDVVEEGLGSELELVVEFAEGRLLAARGAGGRGKELSRAKGGKRPRGGATAGGVRVDGGLPSGLSELIRVCVRGGKVMGEEGWLAVVRLALPGAEKDGAAAEEISREIHERVREAFKAEAREVRSHNGASSPVPSGAFAGDPRLSLDIENGRRSSGGKCGAAVQAAFRSPASAAGSPLIDGVAMSKMKVADLRRELSARGIPITGLKLKTDLLARLANALRGEEEQQGAGNGCLAGSVALRPSTPSGVGSPAAKGKGSAKRSSATARRTTAGSNGDVGGNGDWKGTGGGGGGGGGAERHPVVLVLDEELQAIPWEGLPCLRGHAVTRVPAVPFVFAALATRWDGDDNCEASSRQPSSSSSSSSSSGSGSGSSSRGKPSPASNLEHAWIPSRDGVRLDRGYYVLDPEANLAHTRHHLGPVFQGLGRRLGWSGVEGEAPTEETMAKTLQEVDVFAYCGHGAGELLVGRDTVAGLARCPVAVLMGCSSGRLKGYGDFEPMGMATSYLAGGSPAVVANLWDVTDKDIDRFSVALLEAFVGKGGASDGGGGKAANTLAHAVAHSRAECKMPFIIGYAPVCYGIPMTAAPS